MKVTLFSIRSYEIEAFTRANVTRHELNFSPHRLTAATVSIARDSQVVACFANDELNREVISKLAGYGVGLIALRSAGYNHVDLAAAKEFKIPVVRVPDYSPFAVAEHAVGLLLCLNRKIHRAFNRVRELNFSLEGLVGFDLHGKTVGVIGTGRIGTAFCKIMNGFGCQVLAFDVKPNPQLEGQVKYVDLDSLFRQSDILSLHVPLSAETHHILDARAFDLMKPNVYVINTGRGALIETRALISSLKAQRIGGACLDVYEEEDGVFFQDLSAKGIDDDTLARLLTFPNVVVTAHQAFLTAEALKSIADTTMDNVTRFEIGHDVRHRVA